MEPNNDVPSDVSSTGQRTSVEDSMYFMDVLPDLGSVVQSSNEQSSRQELQKALADQRAEMLSKIGDSRVLIDFVMEAVSRITAHKKLGTQQSSARQLAVRLTREWQDRIDRQERTLSQL